MDRSITLDENARLDVIRRYNILDTPPDGAFDRLTAIGARIFNVPICIVSIVDEDRIWFKSHYGIDVEQIEREPGLCASAILQYEPWIVTNAEVDPRTLTNSLVCGELGLRFYAGVPLTTSEGYNLGTFNIIDVEPRELTDEETQLLTDLAGIVVDELELRLSAVRLIASFEERRRRGFEIHDNIVQHLTVAKLAFEIGRDDYARDSVEWALEAAKTIATDLMKGRGKSVRGGELVRRDAAARTNNRAADHTD